MTAIFWQKIFDSVSNVEMFLLSINFFKGRVGSYSLPVSLFSILIESLRFLFFWNFPSTAVCVRETVTAETLELFILKTSTAVGLKCISLGLFSSSLSYHTQPVLSKFFYTVDINWNVWAASEEMLFYSNACFVDGYWKPRKRRPTFKKKNQKTQKTPTNLRSLNCQEFHWKLGISFSL